MIRNLLALTGLLAIALVVALGIQAYAYHVEEDGDLRRVRVDYSGLDLASPRGLEILEQRVNRAIDQVCDDTGYELWRQRSIRECREQAIAGVTPQIDYAVDQARRRRARVTAEEDLAPPPPGRYAPPPPPPPPPPVYAPAAEQPPLKLVRRTVVTTRTVTTTGPTPPPPPRPAWRPRPVVQPLPARTGVYHRLPEQPGSWLPPAAWRAINGAIFRAFQTGRTTPWFVAGREGYVTVSDRRWVNGCVCRNVRSVKYADGRQIVVAEGMKCLPRGG